MALESESESDASRPVLPPGAPGYRRVALRLRQDIVDGVIAPGEWLRLQSIAELCGVSVQPVREALQLLEGEGLLQIFPNRGAQVRGIDRRRIEHIYDIRGAVEAMLVRRFCESATSGDIDHVVELQAVHDKCSIALDVAATSAANFALHHFINAHAGNAEALALVERYAELGQSLHRRFRRDSARLDRARLEHHMLIDAFRARDVEAAGLISQMHVRATLRDLLANIDALDPTLVPAGLRNASLIRSRPLR